jgi:hypothetical protein
MIKNMVIFVFFLVPCLCFTDDISFFYPKNIVIRDYVSCDLEITSIRSEKTIVPSYKIILTKKTEKRIKELALEVIYYYGQYFYYSNRQMFVLNKHEILMLNTNAQIILSNTLPKMERENTVTEKYIKPDSEYIGDVFYKLIMGDSDLSERWHYSASSFLKERNTDYSPDNLASPDGLPWVSANGYGIGDKIIIGMMDFPNSTIFLINGFVSKDRPDLLVANSRVKMLKLTNLNNGRSIIKFLDDTDAPLSIDISYLNPSKNISLEIEIMAVYPGSKYKDLCIQCIF